MPEDTNGSVRVTLKDVYEAVRRVEADVAEMHSAVAHIPDHESRIRKLEAWRYAVPSSVILAAGALVAALVGAK